MSKIVLLSVLMLGLLTPSASFAQEYGKDEEEQTVVTDDGPSYSSNNPCESADLGDGTPVNCNNAFGADQPQMWQPAPRFHEFQPRTILVWRLCAQGWALVTVTFDQQQIEGE
jgi:hypothetical protein